MMAAVSGVDIVRVARSWLGTPYVHQGYLKGAGCDCLGLLRGIWRETLGEEPCEVPAYTPDWGEPSGQELLLDAALRHLLPADPAQPAAGDVLIFRMRQTGIGKHVGLQADVGPSSSFIHAYTGHGVIESAFSLPWQRRLVARFRLPNRALGRGAAQDI